MTHKSLFALLIASVPLFLVSCSSSDDDLIGEWFRVSDFDGVARSDASSFSIGNKGYLVGGYDGSNKGNNGRLSDTWEFNMEGNMSTEASTTMGSWTQKADFPGKARNSATAFAVGSKGYYGTGYDGEDKYKDFWEYDPSSNTWKQIDDFPGTARYGCFSFGINNAGYVGGGYDDNYLKDTYKYTPSTSKWTQIVSIGGSKRMYGSTFIIDNIAYVVGGINNGTYVNDFWKFTPSNESWTQLRDVSDTSDDSYDDDYAIIRASASVFVIDGHAFITCGESGSIRSDTWEYFPATDLWDNVAKFKGTARSTAVAFSNGKRGFVATGKSSSYRFDDIWEFNPYIYDSETY